MANVVKWGFNRQYIVFNPKLKNSKESIFRNITNYHTILVDNAILDTEIQCMYCGKTIKSGKMVFLSNNSLNSPYDFGDKGWGIDSRQNTFCSSSHAKLFAKNTHTDHFILG
jgi:hypothetical protein